MGRPTKLTPARQKRICDFIRKLVPREEAARLAGVGASTFHRWMAEGAVQDAGVFREFREAVCRAEDDLLARAARTTVDLLDVKEPAVRLNAAKFILSHRFPGLFSTRSEVRTTGPDGGPVRVEAVVTVRPLFSDAQLAEMDPEKLAAAIGALAPAEPSDE